MSNRGFKNLIVPYKQSETDDLASDFMTSKMKFASKTNEDINPPYMPADYFKMILEIALRKLSMVQIKEDDTIDKFENIFPLSTSRAFPMGDYKPARIVKTLTRQLDNLYEIRIDMSDFEHHRILFFCTRYPEHRLDTYNNGFFIFTYGFTKDSSKGQEDTDKTDILGESSCCIKKEILDSDYSIESFNKRIGGF
nr:hypothetical protein [Lysinibacillus sphaericus]